MFDDLWAAAGKRREDYFELVPCDPFYRIFDHEGRAFSYNGDETFIPNQIEQRNPADKAGYQKFMATTRSIFQKGFVELADKPFLHFTDMLKVAPDLIKLQSYKSVYRYVSQYVKDDFLRQCFSFHPLLIGGNPFDAPSIYAMIHYLERQWGIHYAMGGTGAIVQAMVRLFEELGGKIHLNADVAEILVSGRRVTGLRLADGTIHHANQIVSNADVAFTYRTLIPEQYRRKYTNRKIERMKHSMSLFVIYFGTNRRYRDTGLAHHNIILGKRYKGLLDDIFNDRSCQVLGRGCAVDLIRQDYLASGAFSSVDWAADGRTMVGFSSRLWLWDGDALAVGFTLQSTLGAQDPRRAAISPDATRAAVAAGALMELWNLQSYYTPGVITLPGAVRSLDFRPDGTQVVAAAGESVVVYDAASGNVVRQVE
jgi:hypothetical protein